MAEWVLAASSRAVE